MTELTCIVCPRGCRLKAVRRDDGTIEVTGNACPRGEKYAQTELTRPVRVVTTTVKMAGGIHRRCPVKTDGAIPKSLIFDAMRQIGRVTLHSPVRTGQVVLKDVCGTGIDVVATRDLS